MKAQEMFLPPFVQFHTLYEMSGLGFHPSETQAKTTQAARDAGVLPVLLILDITTKHQWPFETSSDSFWPFFDSVTQFQTQ